MTRHPTDRRVAQLLREATGFGQRPTYLIRDNDSRYGATFARVAAASGITVLRTAYRAPRQNATCERFLGSVRRECLDHVLVLGDMHEPRSAPGVDFSADRLPLPLRLRGPRYSPPARVNTALTGHESAGSTVEVRRSSPTTRAWVR